MNKKSLIFLFLIIIFLQIINASQISSSNYQTDSVISSGGKNISSNNYQTKTFFGAIIGNTSSTLYQQSLGFFFCSPYTCSGLGYNCGSWSDGCGGTLSCGTCASGYTCSAGTCTAEPSRELGGGSSTCTYNWICSEWYPEPCPSEGIQKRVCVNKGTCTGTFEMPSTNRTCTPKIVLPAEPLFDIFAKIPLTKKWISPEESIKANIELINLGNTTILDVFFRYWIIDENNTLISELQETRAISERDKFQIEIVLPSNIKIGFYKFYAQITYDENKTAMAQDSFEVVENKIEKFIWPISLILIIILLIIFIIIIKSRRNKKKYKIKEKKIPKKQKKKPIRIGFFGKIKQTLKENKKRKERKKYAKQIKIKKKKQEKQQHLLRIKRQKQYSDQKKAENILKKERKIQYLAKVKFKEKEKKRKRKN